MGESGGALKNCKSLHYKQGKWSLKGVDMYQAAERCYQLVLWERPGISALRPDVDELKRISRDKKYDKTCAFFW